MPLQLVKNPTVTVEEEKLLAQASQFLHEETKEEKIERLEKELFLVKEILRDIQEGVPSELSAYKVSCDQCGNPRTIGFPCIRCEPEAWRLRRYGKQEILSMEDSVRLYHQNQAIRKGKTA